MRRGVAIVVGIVLAAVALAACGGGGDGDPTVVRAGQLNIKLPEGWKVVDGKAVRPAGDAGTTGATATTAAGTGSGAPGSTTPGATATTAASGTTIPLNSGENPQTALFTSLSKFSACLNRDGVKFVGAPDASNPNSPTNDPNYIKSLSKCAAASNILAALKAAQSAQDNLTPEQIKSQNKSYLKWRDCMIARGWKVPEPKPDAKGRLFTFGTSASQQGQSPIVAPPGKDILTSKDLQECVGKAQKSVEK